jgi:hypothetical protein
MNGRWRLLLGGFWHGGVASITGDRDKSWGVTWRRDLSRKRSGGGSLWAALRHGDQQLLTEERGKRRERNGARLGRVAMERDLASKHDTWRGGGRGF